MKKILLMLIVAIAMVSCVEKPKETIPTPTDWVVKVNFLDKTSDTITIRSFREPFMYVESHVSVLTLGDSYGPAASYVKSFEILNK